MNKKTVSKKIISWTSYYHKTHNSFSGEWQKVAFEYNTDFTSALLDLLGYKRYLLSLDETPLKFFN